MVFWNQPLCLHTLLSSVLLADIWSTACAPVVHLLLHTLQTLVQPVPLQQASQLVLWKVSGPLREWRSVRRHWSMSEELSRTNYFHFKTFKNKKSLSNNCSLRVRCTSGGLWNMVRRLLENSFMSLRISCFISGGRLAKSSELMSIELGSSHMSPWDMKNKLTLVSEDSYTINVKTVTHMWTETQGDEFYWIYKEEFVKEKLQKYVNILGRGYQFGALSECNDTILPDTCNNYQPFPPPPLVLPPPPLSCKCNRKTFRCLLLHTMFDMALNKDNHAFY